MKFSGIKSGRSFYSRTKFREKIAFVVFLVKKYSPTYDLFKQFLYIIENSVLFAENARDVISS